MKIKKKDYEKEISDAYWRGFDAGVKIAKEKPELVDRYSVEQIRAFTNRFQKLFEDLGKSIMRAFDRGEV